MRKLKVVITQYREREDRTLKGFLTVRFPQIGLEVRHVAVNEENGRRWLNLPARPYKDPATGKPRWAYYMTFYRDSGQGFEAAVFAALEEFRANRQMVNEVSQASQGRVDTAREEAA
jgi:hypothetical protein